MRLGDLADIRSGSLLDRAGASALYVLAGSIANATLNVASFADGAAPEKSRETASLRSGDVVVSLRGARNPAAATQDLEALAKPVFATLDVAVIRLESALHPEYLTWFLNLPGTQETFATDRSGSAAPRLPLSALRDLSVPVPPLAQQRVIAALAAESDREATLLSQIQQSRQRLLNELLRQLAEKGPRQAPTQHGPNVALQIIEGSAEHSPTSMIGNTEMPNNTSGRKGGTTHVVPAQQGGWNVKQGGAQRATGHFDTKADAVAAARVSSRARESELKIHNLDGKIAQSDSHGNDPRSTKG